MIELKQGDCLELMKDIPDKSVDMILCDLPYGITQCEWDKKISFSDLWVHYNRVIFLSPYVIMLKIFFLNKIYKRSD